MSYTIHVASQQNATRRQRSEAVWLEIRGLGTGRVNLRLSTETEHDHVLLAADVPPRDADFALRAVGESLKHLRLYEPTRQSLAPAGSQGIHYGRPFVEV
jgi:hypothetical protein